VLEDNIKALIKPQYVDHIPRAIKGEASVSKMLDGKLEMGNKDEVIRNLSGGELQRFAIGMSCVQKANV
jgi:ATP-binding cassette, sub-family E, member 1